MVMRDDDRLQAGYGYHDRDGIHAQGGYPDDQDELYAAPYEEEEPAPRKRRITSLLVVFVGLGAFGAIITYAYNQGMRAGTETVAPILRADPTPTKVRPEQPGGLQVPHQDKLVYERLNPAAQQPRVERLLPPPESPLDRPRPVEEPPPDLADDVTMGLPTEEEALEQFQAGMMGGTAAGEPPTEPTPPAQATQAPVALAAPTQQPAAPAAPVEAAPAPRPAPTPAPSAPATVAQAPPPAAAAVAPAAPPPAPAAPAAGGTARVQVGAVDSEAKARAEWARLQRLHPELASLRLTIQQVDLGARGIFHRIQGTGISAAEADRICAALKARGAGCIVVR